MVVDSMHDLKETTILPRIFSAQIKLIQLSPRTKENQGIGVKTWGCPTKISCNDCAICLVQGVTAIPRPRRTKESWWRIKKNYNYNSSESFKFNEVLFDYLKELGFNTMHKLIRYLLDPM